LGKTWASGQSNIYKKQLMFLECSPLMLFYHQSKKIKPA
jgi:hypothetical protein